ncbi:hypothetical protein AMELA_G00283270 [Ameiurus melas]|uniref:Uncharacterized protein n=1 Tax=Ameiurus melas TaxID=219545 RepID=A0A7J5ZMU9_AMEME|nr:hypothetical protein AMELA_G00283270 [Ameiurus melas]
MDSEEVRLCFSRKPPHNYLPGGSQSCGDAQTEICTASGGGTSGSVVHVTPVDLQNMKKEEPGDDDYLCNGPSCSVGNIAPVDQQKLIKNEEPEDEDYLKLNDAQLETKLREQHPRQGRKARTGVWNGLANTNVRTKSLLPNVIASI